MLEVSLKRQAYAAIDRRKAAFEKLKSQVGCRKWKDERQAFFLRQLGGLPERTPLNPKIVGTLKGEGYRIVNVLFDLAYLLGRSFVGTRVEDAAA